MVLTLLRFVIDLSPAAASIDGDVFPMLLGRFNVIDLPESEDLVLLRRQAQELMRSFPVEYWRDKDRNREFPKEYFEAAAKQGFFGITVPEEYGGLGMGMEAACAVMNEVARQGGGLPAGDIMMRELVFGGLAISRFGTKGAKEKYLPALVEGKVLMAIAHTEPNAGVNTFAIETRALRKDGGFSVRGQKVWITLGHMADLFCSSRGRRRPIPHNPRPTASRLCCSRLKRTTSGLSRYGGCRCGPSPPPSSTSRTRGYPRRTCSAR
jgi:Acyl-CoA dehydrogenases